VAGVARRANARDARRSADPGDDGNASASDSAAPGRGIWSGSISFGLLQIPVTLYTAERRADELHFRQLDKNDLSPIRYERVSSTTGAPVAWKDIVKGYELEPDRFVVLEPDELKKANVKATQTIDIQDFVPSSDIEPAFFATPYYVVPQRRAARAYALLREALATKHAAAVATFVLRTREHLVALLPVGDAIMLEVLRFGHELRKAKDVPLPSRDGAAFSERELAMAEQLIDGMMTAWEPTRYRDHFHADVRKMIEEKARTGVVRSKAAEARGEVATDVVDLLALLKRSVEGRKRPAKAGPKAGPSAEATPGRGPRKAGGPKKASTARRAGHKHEAA
jgi:DNA end-binding protein Ku